MRLGPGYPERLKSRPDVKLRFSGTAQTLTE
jgi:hypothetical protein